MLLQALKRKHTPLIRPNSIAQLLKAARKGHCAVYEPSRLEKLRHRRGIRGHETQKIVTNYQQQTEASDRVLEELAKFGGEP